MKKYGVELFLKTFIILNFFAKETDRKIENSSGVAGKIPPLILKILYINNTVLFLTIVCVYIFLRQIDNGIVIDHFELKFQAQFTFTERVELFF